MCACGILTAPAAGQEGEAGAPGPCPDGRISRVFVDNHSIFDVDAIDGGVRALYRLANSLHVKTRESFIRGELLFSEGDCYDPLLLDESGRVLRSYVFIARADVFAVDQPDGTKHVVVDTQDEWTTRVDFGVSFDDGLEVETLEVSEENLLGRGAQASVFFRQRKERQDVGARAALPRLFETRTDLSASVGRTRSGHFFQEAVAYPFVGEVGRFAVRQTYRRRDELFPFVTGAAISDFSHVLLPFVDERIEFSLAGRLGRPGNLTLLGLGISRETLDFEDFPASLEIARDNDFDNRAPAPSGVVDDVAAQTRETSTTRLNFFVGQRNLRFTRVRGLDPLAGVQDIQLGTDIGLTLGRGVDLLSGSDLESSDDLYTRLRLFAGHDPGSSFIFFSGGLEGRHLFSGDVWAGGWRDVIGEFDVYGYLRSRKTPGHTFFARVSGAGGWSMDTPFQLTLGGRKGVRGLREEDFPGAHRILFSFEDRYLLGGPARDFLDLGLTLFADAGRIWAGDVPYGTASGWRGTVGGGVRVGFPAGTRGVARLDLAFPVGMGSGGKPVFRVTLYELLGLTTGFRDPQLQRSRFITVGPDSFTLDRR